MWTYFFHLHSLPRLLLLRLRLIWLNIISVHIEASFFGSFVAYLLPSLCLYPSMHMHKQHPEWRHITKSNSRCLNLLAFLSLFPALFWQSILLYFLIFWIFWISVSPASSCVSDLFCNISPAFLPLASLVSSGLVVYVWAIPCALTFIGCFRVFEILPVSFLPLL